MRVTATEAKNRLGSLYAQVKRGPVFVEKADRIDTMIFAAAHCAALRSTREKAGLAAHKKAFDAEHADWTAGQNARFETDDIPGDTGQAARPEAPRLPPVADAIKVAAQGHVALPPYGPCNDDRGSFRLRDAN